MLRRGESRGGGVTVSKNWWTEESKGGSVATSNNWYTRIGSIHCIYFLCTNNPLRHDNDHSRLMHSQLSIWSFFFVHCSGYHCSCIVFFFLIYRELSNHRFVNVVRKTCLLWEAWLQTLLSIDTATLASLGTGTSQRLRLALLVLSGRYRLYHVVSLTLYERPKQLESDSKTTPTCKLSTRIITQSPNVKQLVHNIWQTEQTLHLGEYSPLPWVRLSIKLPCTMNLSCLPWVPLVLPSSMWLLLTVQHYHTPIIDLRESYIT
jgi:hypothetical protein